MSREFHHVILAERARAAIRNPRKAAEVYAGACWYCSAPATSYCEEPVTEPWITSAADLEPFALIQDAADLQWYLVEKLERVNISTPGCPWLNDEVVAATLKRRRDRVVRTYRPLLPILELRTAPCGRPVCDTHNRDLGRIQCSGHWDAEFQPEPGELELAATWRGLLETAHVIGKGRKKTG